MPYSRDLVFLPIANCSVIAQEKIEAKTLVGNAGSPSTRNLSFFLAPANGLTRLNCSSASIFSNVGQMEIS